MPRPTQQTAVLGMLAAAVLFGTTGTAQAFGPPGADPLSLGAVRQAIGGTLLAALGVTWWLLRFGPRLPRWSGKVGWVLLGGSCVMAFQATFFFGTRGNGVAVGTVLALGSSPLFAGLFDWFGGRPPSRRWVAATGLAVTGILLLSGVLGHSVSLQPVAVLASLAAGAAYAGYAVATAALVQRGLGALPATAAVVGTSGLLGWAVLLFTDNAWLTQPRGLAVALWLGGVTVVVCYLLMGAALRHLPAATAITLGLAEPLTAAVLGVAVLGEQLAPAQLAGLLLVLGGVFLAGARLTGATREVTMPSFTTTLLLYGNNVGIEVPEEIVAGFGAGKRVPVIVTIAGYSYPSTIAVMGGRYLLPLAAEHRRAAGVAGGETHEVTLTHDTSARDTPVPDDLAEALAAAGLRARFDALAPSHRKAHVRSVTEARAEATRQRRIEKVLAALA